MVVIVATFTIVIFQTELNLGENPNCSCLQLTITYNGIFTVRTKDWHPAGVYASGKRRTKNARYHRTTFLSR
jgi:hypothetical protein